MKKEILILTATALVMLTSCSDVATKSSDNSAPKVETEMWGVDENESKSETGSESEPITLTYAIIGEILPEETKLIEQFNESDNGYVIETRDYSSYVVNENGEWIYDEEKDKALDIALTQDIANGEIDIFRDCYLGDFEKMDTLAAKGAFVDLYSFMENDPDVNTSTLNEHILQLHETDGKLYMLPTYYWISTLIGETRYVGDKENWTLDEFISHWEQMPEGSKIAGNTEKDYVYMTILRSMIDTYIDYENAAVHFDSPEFIRALEYCNTFDDIKNYKTDYDPNAVDFVKSKIIDSFDEFHTSTLWNEENQPITFVGFPSDSGSGALISTSGDRMAISSLISEEKQQGAWEFIKRYAMEEYQTEHYCQFQTANINGETKQMPYNFHGFPMNLNAYNKIAKETMEGKYNDKVVSFNGIEHEVGWLTQDELDRLTNYINSIQNLSVGMDRDLWEIINDEIMSYFKGEKTIEETIELIQNRASIMVSEKQ